MRFIDIKFSQRNAVPGGIIKGVVVVQADYSFDCNCVILKIKGREKTEMGSGENGVMEDYIHATGALVLSEATTIPRGTTEFPFGFVLDENLPPTYSGYYGWIEYEVEAVVEMDWRVDPKMTRRFRVLPFHPTYIPELEGYNPKKKKTDVLHVELPSDILRMRAGIPIQFLVEEKPRVTGVRIEIIRRESAMCRRRKSNHDTTISRKFIPLSSQDYNRWNEVIVGADWRRVPFKSKLMATSYYLKIVLELKWASDPFVTFKIKISGEKPEEKAEDIFDDLAIDLGFS